MPFSPLLLIIAGLLAASVAGAQQNLVVNGDFQKFTPTDNLWDGVDGAGFLAGFRRGTYATTESGKVGGLEMPISVSLKVDINGDGLPDLITADPAGVLRAYINSGTKTEPKSTYGEGDPNFPAANRQGQRLRQVLGDKPRTAFPRSLSTGVEWTMGRRIAIRN